MRRQKLILETDGASRGNPGLAGAGVVIRDDSGRRVETIGKFLGVTTNNQAEYQALITGLEAAGRHNPESIEVHSDSELLVRQMTGAYRVRNPAILPLYARAMELTIELGNVSYRHVPREQNSGADKLANVAIDSRGRRSVLEE